MPKLIPLIVLISSVIVTSPSVVINPLMAEVIPRKKSENPWIIPPETGSLAEGEINNPSVPTRHPFPLKTPSLITRDFPQTHPMSQVTSVSQLSDVQPTDWAFQALKSLVERYGIIIGYPDGTFRGIRSLSRYEFAAALNATLDHLNNVLANATENTLSQSDLTTLKRLQEEFAAELTTLKGQVDALEVRTAELEANQFSTTTKLTGDVIFNYMGAFGADTKTASTLHQQVVLFWTTSFFGKDRLITAFVTGNGDALDLPGDTREGFQVAQFGDTDNEFVVAMGYIFPVNDQLEITLVGTGGFFGYFIPTVNPFFDGFELGSGSPSEFGQRNPIYRFGSGAGIGVTYKLNDAFTLSGGYLAANAGDPHNGKGVFSGDYSALAQIVWSPSSQLKLGLTYLNSYFSADNFGFGQGLTKGQTGTGIANSLNGLDDEAPVIANSYGVEFSWQPSAKFVLNSWVGLTQARLIGLGEGDIWNYAINLGFLDLGGEGNMLGFVVGAAPTLRSLSVPHAESFSRDFAYQIEAFYKYKVSDNLSITPELIWLPSLNQNSNNDDVFMGVLRTTFSF